jgi:hypothetical protein
MLHQLLNPGKALRTLRKTPAMLKHALQGMGQHEATTRRDGSDGWNILFIVCRHLYDIEGLYVERIQLLLSQAGATFTNISNDDLNAQNRYEAQQIDHALAGYLAQRQTCIRLLEGLTDQQWHIAGIHPQQGPASILDVAINIGLHDIDHIEQILRCA